MNAKNDMLFDVKGKEIDNVSIQMLNSKLERILGEMYQVSMRISAIESYLCQSESFSDDEEIKKNS